MPEFRKKPVVVEAIRWTGENTSEVIDWILSSEGGSARYHEAQEAFDDGTQGCPATPASIAIDTLEGTMSASVGDWIIRGVQGEHYPCKPDIFEATYETREEPAVQKPSLARMVLALVDPIGNNGADVCPAVITRVWGEHPDGGWTVNIKTVKDGNVDEWLTSVRLVDTEEQAGETGRACFWPPRV